ncbi:MAG TPA: hypothetical protein VFE62_14005 [Gemmataceae bacterium]|nr:hypothetical protein [Gemmataceae bacterium]
MQKGKAIRTLCGLVAVGGIGADLFYVSLAASERAAVDARVVRFARDLFEKSVDTLNYIEARVVEKMARAQSD